MMKCDLDAFWDTKNLLQPAFITGWQEQFDYYSPEADKDAAAMYFGMSV